MFPGSSVLKFNPQLGGGEGKRPKKKKIYKSYSSSKTENSHLTRFGGLIPHPTPFFSYYMFPTTDERRDPSSSKYALLCAVNVGWSSNGSRENAFFR